MKKIYRYRTKENSEKDILFHCLMGEMENSQYLLKLEAPSEHLEYSKNKWGGKMKTLQLCKDEKRNAKTKIISFYLLLGTQKNTCRIHFWRDNPDKFPFKNQLW